MTTMIPVQGKKIEVQFVPHAIRISTDEQLEELLLDDMKKSTAELVIAIKTEYLKRFNADLKISNHSMSVEIWGHAYADRLAKWIQTVSNIRLINRIAGKISFHARLIDIGERGHDNNRFVWDALSPFLSLIAFFLP